MYGGRPNELVMKRLAVTGAALMVVAHAAKRSPQLRTYAGECVLITMECRVGIGKHVIQHAGECVLASM